MLAVNVTNADGEELPGDFDEELQTWNVSNWCPMDPNGGPNLKRLAAPANGKRAGGKGGRDGTHKRYFVDEDGVRWEANAAEAVDSVPPLRTRTRFASKMYTAPPAATTPIGLYMPTPVAGPSVPLASNSPLPATVEIVPEEVTARMRRFDVSAM